MKKIVAEKLIKKTEDDYNLIAEDFSRTRGNIWEELLFLFNFLKTGDRVLDLGCGNARFFKTIKNRGAEYFGLDASKNLINIAKEKYPEAKLFVGSALSLPFQNDYFDNVYSIAVFHQIPSEEFRLQFLKEAKRVLKKNGYLTLVVWKASHKKQLKAYFKYTILKLLGKTDLDFGDAMISFSKKTERYYHFFSKRELKNLIEKAGFRVKKLGLIKNAKRNRNNFYLVALKK